MKKILLIEDDSNYIWHIKNFLQRKGYHVLVAFTVSQGKELIDNIVYCLVSSMRKKIEPELKQCRYIKTVRGVGYKFEGKKMDIFPE